MMLPPPETVTRYKLSLADYHKMIESGILGEDDPIELIHGELIEMSPMKAHHAWQIGNLFSFFNNRYNNKVFVTSQTPLPLGNDSEPEPDILLLRPPARSYKETLPTSQDVFLVLEVADTTLRYDREVKAPLYASAGISEYWLVNLAENCIEVFREPTPNGYRQQTKFWRDDALSLLAFPEVTITAGEILD